MGDGLIERLKAASEEAKRASALQPSVRWARVSYHDIDAMLAKLATAVDGLNWISLKGSCPFAGGKARQTLDAIQERT